MSAISGLGAETNALAGKIKAILPDRAWTIEDRSYSIVIKGPEVKTLWQVSLPAHDKQELWRDYSTTQRVEIVIEYQGPISDEDVAEVQNLKERFEKVMKRVNLGMDKSKGKGGDVHVRRFGFVRLPDYRSSSYSLFVSDNVAARGNSPLAVDPDAVRETVRKIYGVIEDYCKSEVDSVKKRARSSVPEPSK